MPTNVLTDARCRAARAGEKAIKIFDGGGLFLFVSPKGGKAWRLAYRLAGQPKQISLGAYPDVSLADARARRDEVKTALRSGVDPMLQRRAARGTGMTFVQACAAYFDGRNDLATTTAEKAQAALRRHLFPLLGQRPVAQIERAELLDALMKMDAAGLYVNVRKVRGWASQVLDWAVEHGHAHINAAALINPRKAFGRHTAQNWAALELREVPHFLQRLALERDLQSVLACRLLALTWVRTGELRAMRWAEIDGDVWRIPAARMKRRRDHVVPLSRQAAALIDMMSERARGSEYVFPSDRRLDRPMSENSVLYLIGRIGYKGRMTGHGWRSVGSTWANENGWSADAIERQLAHAPDDKVRAVYNRAEYMPERRRMLQSWADWLEAAGLGAFTAERRAGAACPDASPQPFCSTESQALEDAGT